MTIRPLKDSDVNELRTIHAKYYSHEFSFDDFARGFLASCCIESSSGEIVSAGGIRPLTEIVLVTNKDFSVRERREALYKMLTACMYSASKFRLDSLHAFVQDDVWIKHLKRVGFKDTKGKSLILNL
jgi:hypothetical protein